MSTALYRQTLGLLTLIGLVQATCAEIERPQSLPKIDPPSEKSIQTSISLGTEFLRLDQNPDGSWGSARQTKGLNIFAPVPGSHRAFRLAITALCVSALIETKSKDPFYKGIIKKGEGYLLEHLPHLRRATGVAIYNVWAHAYGIQALVRMGECSIGDSARKAQIGQLIRIQFDMLQRYESVDGGWGYYDFRLGSKQPASSSISFVNGTVLLALHEAKKYGIEPPEGIIKRAYAATQRQRLPDHSYLYGEYLKWKPRRGINRPAGSLGRSHACNIGLQVWGDKTITPEVHKTCLDRLIVRNGWLDIGRKRPVPHESWFAVAGYFFYYGHYYAAYCIETLPHEDKPRYQEHLAHILMPLQEKDGSWWDFPFYDYHQQYGTALALMSLQRCITKH